METFSEMLNLPLDLNPFRNFFKFFKTSKNVFLIWMNSFHNLTKILILLKFHFDSNLLQIFVECFQIYKHFIKLYEDLNWI